MFPNYLKIGDKLAKTFFVFSYPRYLSTGWFEPLINLPNLFDISIFINPIDTGSALKNLRKKAGQLESQMNEEQEKGLVRNPVLETAINDVEGLRDSLQQSEEKLFDTGVYITIYADTTEELARLESKLVTMMEAKLIYIKPALFEQLEGLSSILAHQRGQIADLHADEHESDLVVLPVCFGRSFFQRGHYVRHQSAQQQSRDLRPLLA